LVAVLEATPYGVGTRSWRRPDQSPQAHLESAAHALLAHLQRNYPGLLAAQEAFHFTRTHTGRTGARRRTSLDMLLGRLFRNRLEGQEGRPVTGSRNVRALVEQYTGTPVLLGPLGPLRDLDPMNADSALALLRQHTAVVGFRR
jgi:hypothetical protein